MSDEDKEVKKEEEVKEEEKKGEEIIDEEEKEFLENLRVSFDTVGPLYPVIETEYGVAAGATRLKAVPEWPKKGMKVKTYFNHLMVMAASNLHKPKSKEWWHSIINAAGKDLMKQGVLKGHVAEEIAKALEEQGFPLTEHSIRKHLGIGFKDEKMVAVRMAHEPVVDAASTEKKAGESRAQAKGVRMVDDNEYPRTRYTKGEQSLLKEFSARKMSYKAQEPYPREGELTRDGHVKQYVRDVTIGNLILEVEGKGSASSDNPKRDKFFRDKGYYMVHVPDQLARKYPYVVADFVELLLEVIKVGKTS